MGKCMDQKVIIDHDLEEALEIIKEIYNMIDGPWDDPVISESLYNRMETIIENN